MVFESNLMEGAGLGLQETKRVVDREFPKLPDTYHHFLNAQLSGKMFLADELTEAKKARMFSVVEELRAAGRNVVISVSYKDRARPIVEVMRHYVAYNTVLGRTYDFKVHEMLLDYFLQHAQLAQVEPTASDAWDKIRALVAAHDLDFTILDRLEQDMASEGLRPGDTPQLLTEDFIKKVHAVMMEDLLPGDCDVRPGEYRTDERRAGWEHVYPAPKLVPEMMQRYVERANKIVNESRHPAEMAAKISYDFARIHPFPDGNGRMSRLLMQMVLRVRDVPFVVSIRGDAKGKKRYRDALRRAPKDGLDAMVNLIARAIVDAFDEIDDHFKLAEIPTILSFADGDVHTE